MNRKIFENCMHTEPDTMDKKYMFIVDNIDLALSIIDAGFSVVALQEDSDAFFSPDGLMEYLNSIAFLGTCRMDYMYVPACSTKKANVILAEFFKEEYLDYREGWMLFKDKDYLQKLSHRTEMQKLLHSFMSLSPSTQKHNGKKAGTCSVKAAWDEMRDVRRGRDETIDRSMTDQNVWLCGSTDMDMEAGIQK